MRSIIVFLGWLAILVHARDIIRTENPPRYMRLLKDKRGISDHPLVFPSHGSPSFSATSVHPSLSSGYNLGGSSGFSLGHAALQSFGGGSSGHGIGYSLPSSGYTSGLASGYISPALGSHHGSLGALQGISLGGHSAQSAYSVPSLGSASLFSPSSSLGSSKTGPVTFGLHGGTSPATSSSFVSAGPGLSAYGNSGPSLSVMLASHGGLLSSSSPSHSVTGGLVFGPTRGASSSSSSSSSSGYSLPASSHGSSSSYSLPITSGSSGVHAALSSGSSASSSSYDLPYSSSGSSSYLPPHSNGASSSYSSASASSYSSSPSYASSSGASSYSSPSVVYGGASSSYTPTYTNSASSSPQYATESHGAYSSVSPRYHLGKSYQDKLSGSAKYDTISYSSPNGKY